MLFTYVNAGVAPFSPTDIADLELWLDASDTGTISSAGGLVSQWNDKSGNGYNATQATGSMQPTTNLATINGLNAIRWIDGGGDSMHATFASLSQPNIIFVVIKQNVITGSKYVFDGGGSSTRHALFLDGSGNLDLFAGSSLNGPAASTSAAAIYTALYNGGSSTFRINGGTSLASGNTGSHSLNGFTIGARYNNVEFLSADIGEILIYNRNISDSEKNQVGNYLATKWGITWTNI